MTKSLLVGITFLGCVAGNVHASCEEQSRSENLVLMNCERGVSVDVLKETGRNVCGDDQTCNVWFWEDRKDIPAVAPLLDSELPKSLASSATAVWVNDSDSLLQLKKVK